MIEGAPLILLQDGKPIEKNLRSERLNVDDLQEQARGQGIESLDDVKWCVLEASGGIGRVDGSEEAIGLSFRFC